MVNCFRRWLTEESDFPDDAIAVCAPTGTAAFNVSGRTMHSSFKLPVPLSELTFQDLSGPSLESLQDKFRNARVIVIDEMSTGRGSGFDACFDALEWIICSRIFKGF